MDKVKLWLVNLLIGASVVFMLTLGFLNFITHQENWLTANGSGLRDALLNRGGSPSFVTAIDHLRFVIASWFVSVVTILLLHERKNLKSYNITAITLIFAGIGCTFLAATPGGIQPAGIIAGLVFLYVLVTASLAPTSWREAKWMLGAWLAGTLFASLGVVFQSGRLSWNALNESSPWPVWAGYGMFLLGHLAQAMPFELMIRGFVTHKIENKIPLVITLSLQAVMFLIVRRSQHLFFSLAHTTILLLIYILLGLLVKYAKAINASGMFRATYNLIASISYGIDPYISLDLL